MKKIILIHAAFCFLFSDVAAQEIEWQNTIGGSGIDDLYKIIPTNDGGYICGGISTSNISGDKTENCMGNYDYWIVKLDSSGTIQWQNTIGGSEIDNLRSLALTNDGGFICCGDSRSNASGDKTENNRDSTGYTFDYWIVKLDASGNVQWDKTIGGSKNDYLSSIVSATDGGFLCAGFSNSNISGDKTENNWDTTLISSDYWIVKLDSSGNIQWQNTIGGTLFEMYVYALQADDGDYFLTGSSVSDSTGDKTEHNIGMTGGWDFWVLKLDSAGNILWQNDIGGSGSDVPTSIAKSADGNYILGGTSTSNISGDKTENCLGSVDYWVVKTDTLGNVIWDNTIGGNGQDQLISMCSTADNGFICGGFSVSPLSFDKTENNIGYSDFWIIKADSSGAVQWDNTIGGIYYDNFGWVAQAADGTFICAGGSFSNISGDKSENNMNPATSGDYWVMKLSNSYNIINGKLFYDFNNNQIQDTGELPLKNKMVTEINTGRFNFSNQNGNYLISVWDSGNFSDFPVPVNYYTAVPAIHAAYFSGINQTDSLNDFAFQATILLNDLCITITPMGNFRANMNANYMINYENVGTTTLNGTVIFFPDNDVTFVSSNVTPTSVTTDSVVWNVGTLTPFQTGNILVTVHVNAGTPIGTLINSSVVIEPVAGDANTACNYNAWEVFVTGAVDPNEILVDRDTVLTTELSSPPYLNYIIYFQNTGNDTAFNARVLNNIPQMLDVNSFEFVASSHPMNITYGAHARLMEFTFDNILLPDSNVNEPASHGFIRYRIKPLSTLVAGDQIKNNAAIYFDFNQPVMTDTAVTEIVLPTGEEEFKVQSLKFKVFPNPVSDELVVRSREFGEKAQIKIYDLFGREVLKKEVRGQRSEVRIDVSGFSQGIYLVQLNSGEKTARAKFVKQ